MRNENYYSGWSEEEFIHEITKLEGKVRQLRRSVGSRKSKGWIPFTPKGRVMSVYASYVGVFMPVYTTYQAARQYATNVRRVTLIIEEPKKKNKRRKLWPE